MVLLHAFSLRIAVLLLAASRNTRRRLGPHDCARITLMFRLRVHRLRLGCRVKGFGVFRV